MSSGDTTYLNARDLEPLQAFFSRLRDEHESDIRDVTNGMKTPLAKLASVNEHDRLVCLLHHRSLDFCLEQIWIHEMPVSGQTLHAQKAFIDEMVGDSANCVGTDARESEFAHRPARADHVDVLGFGPRQQVQYREGVRNDRCADAPFTKGLGYEE